MTSTVKINAKASARPTTIEYFDRLSRGWFVLDVMRQDSRSWDWVALAVDVDPDDYWPSVVRHRWLRIHGKHKNRESAQHALQDMMPLNA